MVTGTEVPFGVFTVVFVEAGCMEFCCTIKFKYVSLLEVKLPIWLRNFILFESISSNCLASVAV